MTNPASFRFDPWALLVGVVVLGVAGTAFEHRDAIAEVLGPTDDATVTDVLPDRLDERPIDAMRTSLRATHAFELDHEGTSVRAFVLPEPGGDFSVVLYRRGASGFERFGARTYADDFDIPELAGAPPRLQMRERHLGVVMVFVLREHDFELVPLDQAPASE